MELSKTDYVENYLNEVVKICGLVDRNQIIKFAETVLEVNSGS